MGNSHCLSIRSVSPHHHYHHDGNRVEHIHIAANAYNANNNNISNNNNNGPNKHSPHPNNPGKDKKYEISSVPIPLEINPFQPMREYEATVYSSEVNTRATNSIVNTLTKTNTLNNTTKNNGPHRPRLDTMIGHADGSISGSNLFTLNQYNPRNNGSINLSTLSQQGFAYSNPHQVNNHNSLFNKVHPNNNLRNSTVNNNIPINNNNNNNNNNIPSPNNNNNNNKDLSTTYSESDHPSADHLLTKLVADTQYELVEVQSAPTADEREILNFSHPNYFNKENNYSSNHSHNNNNHNVIDHSNVPSLNKPSRKSLVVNTANLNNNSSSNAFNYISRSNPNSTTNKTANARGGFKYNRSSLKENLFTDTPSPIPENQQPQNNNNNNNNNNLNSSYISNNALRSMGSSLDVQSPLPDDLIACQRTVTASFNHKPMLVVNSALSSYNEDLISPTSILKSASPTELSRNKHSLNALTINNNNNSVNSNNNNNHNNTNPNTNNIISFSPEGVRPPLHIRSPVSASNEPGILSKNENNNNNNPNSVNNQINNQNNANNIANNNNNLTAANNHNNNTTTANNNNNNNNKEPSGVNNNSLDNSLTDSVNWSSVAIPNHSRHFPSQSDALLNPVTPILNTANVNIINNNKDNIKDNNTNKSMNPVSNTAIIARDTKIVLEPASTIIDHNNNSTTITTTTTTTTTTTIISSVTTPPLGLIHPNNSTNNINQQHHNPTGIATRNNGLRPKKKFRVRNLLNFNVESSHYFTSELGIYTPLPQPRENTRTTLFMLMNNNSSSSANHSKSSSINPVSTTNQTNSRDTSPIDVNEPGAINLPESNHLQRVKLAV